MLLPSIELKIHPKKGLGLFAATDLAVGTVIWHPCKQCTYYPKEKLANLNEENFKIVDELGYTTYDEGILIPCRNACYMNHSCNANVLDYGLDFGILIQDIKAGEEICCDYRTWDAENWEMICQCNAPTCVKIIHPKDASEKQNWSSKVRYALTQMQKITQPLSAALLENSEVYTQCIRGHFHYLKDKTQSVKQFKRIIT